MTECFRTGLVHQESASKSMRYILYKNLKLCTLGGRRLRPRHTPRMAYAALIAIKTYFPEIAWLHAGSLKRGNGANWRTTRQLSGECRFKRSATSRRAGGFRNLDGHGKRAWRLAPCRPGGYHETINETKASKKYLLVASGACRYSDGRGDRFVRRGEDVRRERRGGGADAARG